jgi:hypothetical protein
MSIHPTTTNDEIKFVCDSIKSLAENHKNWALDYNYDKITNEFIHKNASPLEKEMVEDWFEI